MNMRLMLAGSLRILKRDKLRTFFMSIGILIGVAALVAGRSIGASTEQDIRQKVDRMFGPGTMLVMSRGAEGVHGRRAATLKMADFDAVAERLDQVVAWDPAIAVGGCQVRARGATREVTVLGHSHHAERVRNRTVVQGRHFTREDMSSAARVALIGTRMAEHLFAESNPIDGEILINSAPFRVVGILEPIGMDPHGDDRDEDVLVPATTAMRRLRNVDFIGSAKLVVRDPDTVDEDAALVGAILRERHGIGPGDPDDFAIFTSKFAGSRARAATRVMQVYLPAAAALLLLLAGVVISVVMLSAVRQRIAEIGLRKAVGATESQISYQFLAETVAITLLSGLAGLGIGAGVATLAAQRMSVPPVITAESLVLGLAAAIVVGLIAGIAPARRAARLDPVEALR